MQVETLEVYKMRSTIIIRKQGAGYVMRKLKMIYTVENFISDVSGVLPFEINRQLILAGFGVDSPTGPQELRRMIFRSVEKIEILLAEGLPATAGMNSIYQFLENGGERIEYWNRGNVVATVDLIKHFAGITQGTRHAQTAETKRALLLMSFAAEE